jgi:hypothetical protein
VSDWERVHGGDPTWILGIIGATIISIAGIVIGIWSIATVGAGGILMLAFCCTVWPIVAWRGAFMGIYISDEGVQIRDLRRTQTIPWASVVHAWAGPPSGQRIWITLSDPDEDLATPVFRFGYKGQRVGRITLSPKAFVAAIATLNARAGTPTGYESRIIPE